MPHIILYLTISLVILYYIYSNYNYESFNNNKRLTLVPRLYTEACDLLKIPYKITDLDKSRLLINDGNKQVFIAQLYNTFNSNRVLKLAKNKYKTFLLLNKHNIPVPTAQLFENINNDDIYKIYDNIKIPYPIVIKQLSGANGAHVYVDIRNRKQVINTIVKLIADKRKDIIVEKFIKGSDYRVLVFNDEVLDVIHRPKPSIIGDGKNTIKYLVTIKNVENSKIGLHSLIIDYDYLDKRNISINDIPVFNKKVVVNPLTNFHQGSYPQRININEIHPDNIKLFSRISRLMGLKFAGIDYLSPNIRKSYRSIDNISAINEINGLPNLDIHYYADLEKNNDVVVKILKSYFKS